VNPDPAVFEAAFVIDDSDEPSRAGTPKPPGTDDPDIKRKREGTTDDPLSNTTGNDGQSQDNGKASENPADSSAQDFLTAARAASVPSELTAETRQKLRKLEKLEATYPGTLFLGYKVGTRPDLRIQSSSDPTAWHIAEPPLSNLLRKHFEKTLL
jgi:hypothetical protein